MTKGLASGKRKPKLSKKAWPASERKKQQRREITPS